MTDPIGRGDRAVQLLENELLVEAFNTLEETYTQQWKDSPARDTEGREKIFLAIHQLHQVKTHLESVVVTGQMEKATLAERAKGKISQMF